MRGRGGRGQRGGRNMGRGRQNFQMTPNFCVPANNPTFSNQTAYGGAPRMHNPPNIYKKFNKTILYFIIIDIWGTSAQAALRVDV